MAPFANFSYFTYFIGTLPLKHLRDKNNYAIHQFQIVIAKILILTKTL